MRYLGSLASLLLVGCASQVAVEPVGSEPTGTAAIVNAPVAPAVAAASLSDPAEGRICRTTKRPGSNIADTVCYTRAEQLARQEASKEAVDELKREAHWRDQAINDALSRNRYPTGPGLGPR